MKCEKCSSEMIYALDGHSCSWSCPKCGWGIATSYFSPIDVDTVDYALVIKQNAAPTIEMIKCVSRVLSCNFVEAKNAIVQGTGTFRGKASDVKESAEKLVQAGLQYRIEPEFPY